MALVIIDTKAILDDALEIDPPPAHDAVFFPVGAGFDNRSQLLLLCWRQARRRPFRPIIEQPVGAVPIETMHPIAQSLAVHPANARGVAAAHAIDNRRQR